jgi:hypothetical protein
VPSPFWLDVILLEVLFVRNPLCLNVCFCLKSFLFKWNFVRLPISWTMKENIPSVILKQIDGAFSCLVHTLGQAASRTNRNVCSRTKVEQRFLLRHSIRLEKMPRLTWVDSDLASGWPDMFEKSHPKCFAEINTYIFCTVEKVAQWFALKKLPIGRIFAPWVDTNHPRGENSTNQVTLLGLLKHPNRMRKSCLFTGSREGPLWLEPDTSPNGGSRQVSGLRRVIKRTELRRSSKFECSLGRSVI